MAIVADIIVRLKAFIDNLKSKRRIFRVLAVGLSSFALLIAYYVAERFFIPSWLGPMTLLVLSLQAVAVLSVFVLIFLLATELREAFWRNLGFTSAWVAYAAIVIYFGTLVFLIGDLFGPSYKDSYTALSSSKTLHLYEQDCWIDHRTECNDYQTSIHIQANRLPFMRELTTCPCYFDELPIEANGTLEFTASICHDQKERTLLFDLKTGGFKDNVCR